MRAILLLVPLLVASPLAAQDIGGGFVSAGIGNAGIEAVNQQVEDVVVERDLPAVAEASTDVSLSYSSDPSRTRSNLQEFAERAAKADPVAGQQLRDLFRDQPDIVAQTGEIARGFGLDLANVGDAYALWWMSAWLGANRRTDTPDISTIAAVRQQAQAALSATPALAAASDAERQEYAEALIVQAVLINTSLEQNAGDPEQMARLAEATKRGAAASGLDLDTMVLTESGFVPRTGADARDAVDNSNDEEALASSDSASDSALYIGLAAMVAAGVGGAYALGKRASRS